MASVSWKKKTFFYFREEFACCTLCVTNFMQSTNSRRWVLGKLKFWNNLVDNIKIASQTNRLPEF